MKTANIDWVAELFFLLDIPATTSEWQEKFNNALHTLKSEVQFTISTLNNNEQQLIQEAEKRATSFFINGSRTNLSVEMKVVASELLLRNQQPELALNVLQPIDTDGSSEYFVNIGRALMQIGIMDQSKNSFITAQSKNPESAEPLFHLGFHSSICGDVQSATHYYTEGLVKEPGHVGILVNLAYIYYQLDKFEEAIQLAQKAIEVNDSNIAPYLVSCSCLIAKNEFRKCADIIRKARKKFKDKVIELDELESIVAFEFKQYSKVIKLVTRYLETRPNALDLLKIRIKSNIRLSLWDDALSDIEQLISLEAYDVEYLEMKFTTLYAAKRWSEAEVAYLKLAENAPEAKLKYHEEHNEIRRQLSIPIR